MSDLSIEQAIAEVRDLVRCRCHPAFTERKLHDPDCNCDSAEAVEVLANALPAVQPDLMDPNVVHANMLRGTIAKPSLKQIIHLYGVDALAPLIVRAGGRQ